MKCFLFAALALLSLSIFANDELNTVPSIAGRWHTVDTIMGGSDVIVTELTGGRFSVQVQNGQNPIVNIGITRMQLENQVDRGSCHAPVVQSLRLPVPGRPATSDFALSRVVCQGGYVLGGDVLSLMYDTMTTTVGATTKDSMSNYTLIR